MRSSRLYSGVEFQSLHNLKGYPTQMKNNLDRLHISLLVKRLDIPKLFHLPEFPL